MEITGTLPTDSGMHVLWDRAHFVGVRDFPAWEHELLDDIDIERHIVDGHVVPINIRSDGSFVITLRADPQRIPELTELERLRVVATSDRYGFVCAGHLDLSGIEYVSETPFPPLVASAEFPAGHYQTQVHLLDWDDLPARTDDNPDFLLTLGPASSTATFRQSVVTFDSAG